MEQEEHDEDLEEARKLALSENPDLDRAFELLTRAYERGNMEAAYAIGTWYLHGNSAVEKDLDKAVPFLVEAAEANLASALFDLAVCYDTGAGVNRSQRKAFELYVRAALEGDSDAHHEVGRMLFYGKGVRKDRKLAEIWLDRAHRLGVEE